MYKLLFSNDDFIVISKDPGISFHKGLSPVGLVEQIRNDFQLKSLFPVHRLDTMTSGVLVFAKHRTAAQEIAKLFRYRTIDKYYIALAPGNPKKKQGTVRGDMIKGRSGVWILSHTLLKPAVTQFFSAGLGDGLRLYILKPRTGRTHQLRVMMKSLSVPILGDPAYYTQSKHPLILFDRGYLHAFAIRFTFKETLFTFIDPPLSGIHFQTPQFKVKLQEFMEPWNQAWPVIHITPSQKKLTT